MGGFLIDLLDFVVLVLFVIGIARKIGSLFSPSQTRVRTSGGSPPPPSAAVPHRGEMVRDPVCGMFVATEVSEKFRRGADTIHFCSRACMEKYQKEDAEHAAS